VLDIDAAARSGPVFARRLLMDNIRVAVLCGFLVISGCSSSSKNEGTSGGRAMTLTAEQCEENAEIMRASAANNSYLIQPGDDLSIDSYLNPEFSQDVVVRPDGRVSLRLIGAIQASQRTPQQFATDLDQAYSTELRNPDMSVMVKNMPSRQIFVEGQVQKPGGFPLDSGMTALQAIAAAGGLTDNAAPQAVLIRRDACGIPAGSSIDITAAIKNPEGEQDAVLQSRDIVVVPRSKIANVDLWVSQYVRNVLPVEPYFAATSVLPGL
jgi:polysaccharide export outer membrane protein